MSRRFVTALLSVIALVAVQLVAVLTTASPAAALAGDGSNFDCYGNTIYSVQRGGGANGGPVNSTLYALDTTTIRNTTVSATAVTSLPGQANANAFGIAKGGTEAAVVAQTSSSATAVNLYTYDPEPTPGWTTHVGTAGASGETFVAGAIDPSRDIYYYASYNGVTGKATVYGYDLRTNVAISGPVATVTLPLGVTGSGTNINGDMAFDLGGNLYLVESIPTAKTAAVSVVKGALPAAASSTAITSAQLQSYTLDTQQGWNGIAFDNFGRLYIEYTIGVDTLLQRLNPNTGEILDGPTKQGLTGDGLAVDLAACSLNPTVTIKSAITGRSYPSDQFTMSITGGGITKNNMATTDGTTTPDGIETRYAGPVIGVSGTTYRIAQTSTTGREGNYTVTYQCTDAAAGDRVVASGPGSSFDLEMPTPQTNSTGPSVTCLFTDVPSAAALTTSKTLTKVNGNTANASSLVTSGDVLTYALTTTNTGGTAGTARLTDTVPANTVYTGSGEGWNCASSSTAGTPCQQDVTVGPADTPAVSVTKTFTVTVQTLPANTATVSNVASASGATCTGCTATNRTAPVLATSLDIVTVNGAAATPATVVQSGDVVVYRSTTTNTGGTSGTAVLSNPVPSRTTYTGTGQGWDCPTGSTAGTACTQTVAVPAGGSVAKTYTVTVGSTTGVAAITDTLGASAGTCSNCTASNPTPADLRTSLAVTAVNGTAATSATPVAAGDIINYTVTVANTGGIDGTTRLSEQVAANTTYHGAAGESWSCAVGSAANSICLLDVAVAAGTSTTRTYTAQVVAPLPSGTTRIDDDVTSGTGTCTACSVTNPSVAALDTVLALSTVNGAAAGPATTVKAGDRLGYTLTVTNTGGSAGTTTLTQTVPASATYTGTGWTCPNGPGAGEQCTRDVTAPAGGTGSVAFELTLAKPLPADATTVADTATSSNGTCSACSVSNAITPTFSTTVTVDTVNGDPATAARPLATGDEVDYRVRVSNPDGPAGDVVVTDVVPANSTFVGTGWSCATGSPAGTSCSRTVTVAPGIAVDVSFPVRVGTLADGVTAIIESASVSAGSCAACTVSSPTVAKLSTGVAIVSVNGQPATAATDIAAGDVVVYRTTTTNAGGSAGTTKLTEMVPGNSTYTGTSQGWTCNPTDTVCTQDVTVAASGVERRDATVTIGAQPDGTTAVTDTVSSTVGACDDCAATNPTVAALATAVAIVSVNGQPATSATSVRPGDVIEYAVTVSNSGGSTGSTTIGNTVPANTTYTSGQGWSCNAGDPAGTACTQAVTVAPGADVTRTYTVTVVDPLPAGTATIDDTVTAGSGACAACTAGNPTVADLDTTLVLATVNGQPATAGVAIAPGDVLGYRVTVTNTGGTPADVMLGQTVPVGTAYTGTGWTCTAGGACTRTVTGTPGAPVTVDFEVTAVDPLPAGTRKIADTVTADAGTCSACAVANPTLAHLDTTLTLVTVNGSPYVPGTPIGAGDVLGYRATVTNTGGSPGTTVLGDTVPANTTYTGTGEGWSCSTGAPAGTSCTHSVTVGAVAPDDSTTVDYTVTVDQPLPPGIATIENTVTSSSGGCASCSTSSATVGALDAVLTLAEVDGVAAGPATQIAPGAALHYTVTLTNTGGTAVTTTLTQPVPAHTTYVGLGEGWTCPASTCTRDFTVAPGSVVVVDYSVRASDPMPSGVTTIADTVTSSRGTCSACAAANPTVAKLDTTLTIGTVNGDPYAGAPLKAGDVVGYLVSVRNTGGSSGTTTVTETVPAKTTYTGTGWACTGTTCTTDIAVPVGDTATATFEVTVDTPVPDGTQHIDNGISTSNGTCSSCAVTAPVEGVLDTVLEVVTVNGDPATTATQVAAGDEVGYRISVTNSGGASLTTTLTQTIPAHTHYSGTGWTCTGTDAGSTCTRDVTVGANDTESATFVVTVDDLPAGTATIDDSVTSSQGTCSSCTQSSPTVGTLSVSKRVTAVNGGPVAPVAPGDVVSYTITALNTGGSSVTTTLTDAVPAHASYTGTGQGWSCATGAAAGTACTQSLTVAAGASSDVTFTMTLAASLSDGTGSVANTVTSSAGSCTACTATSDTVAALHTTKRLAAVNGRPAGTAVHVRTGDVLAYELTVVNGGGTAGRTTLTEHVPAHTTYTGRGEGWTCTGATCGRDVDVPALRTVVVRFTVTVSALDDTRDTSVLNRVATTAGRCDACQVATTIARADLSVTKTADRASAAIGDRVGFTVEVRNAGPDEARAVVVADRPSGLRLVSAIAERGSFRAGSWTVGTLISGTTAVLHTTYVVTAEDAGNIAIVAGHYEADPTGPRNRASVQLTHETADEVATKHSPRKPASAASDTGSTADTGFGVLSGLQWALLLLLGGAGMVWLARRRSRAAGRHRS